MPSWVTAVLRANYRSTRSVRYYDGHLLLVCSSPAILPNHHNRMLAGLQRLRKITESAVRCDVRHMLAVDDQRSPRLGASDNFRHAAMQKWRLKLQKHFLRLPLRHERELIGIADLAALLLRANGRDIPEIISAFQTADVH